MVLHFSKYFHRIPHPRKHGSRSKNHVSKSIRRKVMYVGVGRHQKYAFWQPCCRKLATLMVLHFPKYFHRIPHPRKHRSRSKNNVSTSIRGKVMFVGVGRHPKYAFWQPCCRNLANLMVPHFPKSFHWIPRPRKHGSRSKNHVSKSIRRKVMLKNLIFVHDDVISSQFAHKVERCIS